MKRFFFLLIILSMFSCQKRNQDRTDIATNKISADSLENVKAQEKARKITDEYSADRKYQLCFYEKASLPKSKTFPFSEATKVDIISFSDRKTLAK